MRIVTLDPRRIAEACSVLAEAFAEEPITSKIIPSYLPDRRRRMIRYFRWIILYTGCSNIDVAIDPETDVLQGVALWEPPGHKPHKLASLRALPAAFFAIGRHGFRMMRAYEASSAQARPAEPQWHLTDIGVRESARGRGVGGALVRARLEKIDATGEIATLEATTPRSAALYARLGFVPGKELAPPAEGTVAMTRPAHG